LNSKLLDISKAGDFVSTFGLSDYSSNIFVITLDVLLVALIFYWIFILFRETRGIRIIYGIILLILMNAIGQLLHLSAFNSILKYLSTMIIVAIPIVLQPELRSALERLGRTPLVTEVSKLKRKEMEILLNQITETVEILSHNKIGALIVISRQTGLREYIENGTIINGNVSTELLLTIFAQNTALHDGAVIIVGNRLVSAGSTLPLTDVKLALSLGTRHRAALGMASQTDALTIVVSEESGSISLALNTQLERNISPQELRSRLYTELNQLRTNKG
jgi:diadenylate cyclase